MEVDYYYKVPGKIVNTKYLNSKLIPKTKCEICGTVENLEVHRIIPGIYRGLYTEDNVSILCKMHHNKIHNLMRRTTEHFKRKFEIHKSNMILELVVK